MSLISKTNELTFRADFISSTNVLLVDIYIYVYMVEVFLEQNDVHLMMPLSFSLFPVSTNNVY